MDFNTAIVGVSDFGGSTLWDWAENWLDVSSETYDVRAHESDSYLVSASQSERNIVFTGLKVALCASLLLPVTVVALAVKAAYRYQCNFTFIQPGQDRRNFPPAPYLKHSIDSFKTNFENTLEKDTSQQHIIQKLYSKTATSKISDYEALCKDLDTYLTDYDSYAASQESVHRIILQALQNLANGSNAVENLAFAKYVYKKMGVFLRENTDQKYLEVCQRHFSQDGTQWPRRVDCRGPESYLPEQKLVGQAQAGETLGRQMARSSAMLSATISLLKQLRRRCKIADKPQRIAALAKEHPHLKEIPPSLIDRSLNYLTISWMHGSKAFALKSAYETCNGEIIPSGELRKRGIAILTGKMELGASAIGINRTCLSGVNLSGAQLSFSFAEGYTFEIDKEITLYNTFLDSDFNKLQALFNRGEFNRQIEALNRVKRYDPERFEKDKPRLILKKEQIYSAIKRHVFDSQPREIYYNGDDYYSSKFYSFLCALGDLEALLAQEGQAVVTEVDAANAKLAKIGVMMASKSRYGVPTDMTEKGEEVHYGALKLGNDIQTIFTDDEHLLPVEDLVKTYDLTGKIEVASMETLKATVKINEALRGYFYDVYNLKKWKKMYSNS